MTQPHVSSQGWLLMCEDTGKLGAMDTLWGCSGDWRGASLLREGGTHAEFAGRVGKHAECCGQKDNQVQRNGGVGVQGSRNYR